MFSREVLVNIALFLERVPPVAGKEAYAWVETHQAVMKQIEKMPAPKADTKTGEKK